LGGNVAVKNNATGNQAAIVSCPVALGSNRIFNVENDGSDSTDLLLSNVISGSASVTKNGLGKLKLTGLNTYSGATVVNSGILCASIIANGGVASSIGQSSNLATNLVIGNAALQYDGNNASTDRAYTLTNNTNAIIDVVSNLLTMSGASAATSGNLIKRGAGSLIFNAYNAYTGNTTISQGSLIAGVNSTNGTIGAFGNSLSSIILGDAQTNNESPSLYAINASTISRSILIDSIITSGKYNVGVYDATACLYSGTITMKQPLSINTVTAGTAIFSNSINSNGNKLTKLSQGIMRKSILPLSLTGDFEIKAGTFDAFGNDVSVNGLTSISGGTYNAGAGFNIFSGGIKQSSGSFIGGFGQVKTTHLNIISGSFIAPASVLEVSGNWNNSGNFINNYGDVLFNGLSLQNISGTEISRFNNLTLDNVNGINLSDTSDVVIAGFLDFSNGKFYTGSNNLILLSTANVLNANSSKYICGNLKKYIPESASNLLFEIGDSLTYAPVETKFNGLILNSNGSIKASTRSGDHPQINSSALLANKTINRNWILLNEDPISGLSSYDVTFNFEINDVDLGVATSNCKVNIYNNGWSLLSTGATSATAIEAVGVTDFGDFQLGEGTDAPLVTNEPENAIVCTGENTSFTSNSNSLPIPSITWQRLKNTDTIWYNITSPNLDSGVVYGGYNSTQLTLEGVDFTLNGYKYRAVFSNVLGVVYSGQATLKVNSSPNIITQPVSPSKICSGNGVQTISVTAEGGDLNYVWRKNGVLIVNDGVINGQGTSRLTFNNTSSVDTGNYEVLVYNNCSSILSTEVNVGLYANLVPSAIIYSNKLSNKFCTGERIQFNAIANNGGSAPQFQWKINGIPVPGENSSTFITSTLNNNDAVSVQMTTSLVICSGTSIVQSNTLFITVNNSPRFVRNYASGCINGAVTIYLLTDTLPALINPWISMDTLIATVENATPNANITGRDTGFTSIIYTDINGCKDTLTYKVTSPLNAPDTIYGPQIVCEYYNNTGYTDTIYYNVDPIVGAASYDWIMPRGAQIVSGWGTNSIGIVIDTTIISRYGGGWIYLGVLNEEGCSSPYISLRLYRYAIPTGQITGPNRICDYVGEDTLIHYHFDSVASVRAYIWTMPSGVTLVNGQGTNDIYVLFSDTIKNGTRISLKIMFNCGINSIKYFYLYRSNPPKPTLIYGSDSVCNVGNGAIYEYSIDSIPGISDYQWVLPNNMTIVSGQGTSTIKVKFNSLSFSYNIKVRAECNCGVSLYTSLTITTTFYNKPGSISGPTNTCTYINTNKPAIYTIKKVANVPYYIWEYPVVGTDSVVHPEGFGPNDTIVKVYYNSNLDLNIEDSIQVRSGGCNFSKPSIFLLKGSIPNNLNSIAGPVNVCGFLVSSSNPNGTLVTYTIPKVKDALSYIWSISGNAAIIDHPAGYGEFDTIIKVKFYSNYSGGTIYVNAANRCGFGSPKIRSIYVYKASGVGLISDTTLSLCPQRIVEYSVPLLPTYADSIIWTVPSVARIISGQSTTRIRVQYPSNINLSSLVSAKSINNCSVGYTRYYRVSFSAVSCLTSTPNPSGKNFTNVYDKSPSREKDFDFESIIYPNPSSDYFNIKVLSPITAKVLIIIYDIQGKEIKRQFVKPAEINNLGSDLKSGVYFIRFMQNGISKIRKIIKL
jgi:autotransporter-associated beta strand protein